MNSFGENPGLTVSYKTIFQWLWVPPQNFPWLSNWPLLFTSPLKCVYLLSLGLTALSWQVSNHVVENFTKEKRYLVFMTSSQDWVGSLSPVKFQIFYGMSVNLCDIFLICVHESLRLLPWLSQTGVARTVLCLREELQTWYAADRYLLLVTLKKLPFMLLCLLELINHLHGNGPTWPLFPMSGNAKQALSYPSGRWKSQQVILVHVAYKRWG